MGWSPRKSTWQPNWTYYVQRRVERNGLLLISQIEDKKNNQLTLKEAFSLLTPMNILRSILLSSQFLWWSSHYYLRVFTAAYTKQSLTFSLSWTNQQTSLWAVRLFCCKKQTCLLKKVRVHPVRADVEGESMAWEIDGTHTRVFFSNFSYSLCSNVVLIVYLI